MRNFHSFNTCSLLLLFGLLNLSSPITFDEFVTLSHSEKRALDKLRLHFEGRIPPEYDYMGKDVYLVRILREYDFNVPVSIRSMEHTLKWKEDNNISNLLKDDDFADFDNEVKTTIEGCDREGRPVFAANIGEFDSRKAVLQGQATRGLQYIRKILAEAEIMGNRMLEDGSQVVQVNVLIDLNGFSLMSHACAQCIPLSISILLDVVQHYPGYINKAYAVNTPSYALPFIDLVKGFLTPKYRRVINVFGKDKKEWRKALFKDIDPSNLSVEYGGSKTDVIDLIDLRRSGKVFRCNMTSVDL